MSESITNNTFIVGPKGYVNFPFLIDTSYLNGTATAANNYYGFEGQQYNTAGDFQSWNYISNDISGNPGPYNGTVRLSGNIDMLTGASLDGSSSTPPPSSPPPPAAPVISTGVENSNQSVTLTGTAADGSTVTVSDGGSTPLGTATASSTGAWSFTTADLSAGSYAFTATDTTSAGTSAASSPFDLTVAGSSPQPSSSNLVANGNFATGDFTDWTLGGNSTSTAYGQEIFIDNEAEGGSTYAGRAGLGWFGWLYKPNSRYNARAKISVNILAGERSEIGAGATSNNFYGEMERHVAYSRSPMPRSKGTPSTPTRWWRLAAPRAWNLMRGKTDQAGVWTTSR